MPEDIIIKIGGEVFEAELNDSVTGKAIYDALPIRAKGQRWGGEIYFSIAVSCEHQENSRDVMEEGELGYWPPGTAFCIFFGPTPASSADEIRAASAVNIVGRMKADCSGLWEVPGGAEVCIEKI
ncbi:MAG: cyclophilin-like fold protein [Planctomycetota bacterium]